MEGRVRRPDRLILLSPCIGVTAFARLSLADQSLSFIPYFERSAWLNVDPEFDPYKYVSFAERCSYEIWRLSTDNMAAWDAVVAAGRAEEMPPLLVFQSAVDSTVLNGHLVELIRKSQPRGDELVVFDVNHSVRMDSFLLQDPGVLTRLLDDPSAAGMDVAVVTNASGRSPDAVVRRRRPDAEAVEETPLGMRWPPYVVSLGHVAIPFPPDDPLYGDGRGSPEGLSFGSIVVRSERAVMSVPLDVLMRTRYNPFFAYVEQRIVESLGLGEAPRP
jgi:hypothetical protein